MTMPIDLVLVRHGQSEGNIAEDFDNNPRFAEIFRTRHNAMLQLTDLGISQAITTGAWIQQHIGSQFDRYYVSEYLRALSTAAHLNLPDAQWYPDLYLRERDHGLFDRLSEEEKLIQFPEDSRLKKLDPLFWHPPRGTSIADLCLRIDRFLDTLHRECSEKKVIAVCHGEVMWAFRIRLERLTHQDYLSIKSQKHPYDKINNCQVLHYSRRHPVTGVISLTNKWVRSTCPWNISLSRNEWQPVTRRAYSNQELLEITSQYPRHLTGIPSE